MSERQRYRMTFKCGDCANVFRKVTFDKDLAKAPCPECKKKNRITKFIRANDGPVSAEDMIERVWEAKPFVPPGKSAESSANVIKAVDETARIVMEDHKMGDLKDSVRVGESMAPKLAPHLQKQADAMFGGGNVKRMIPNAAKIARTAMAGGYRGAGYIDPVSTLAPKYKPPVSYINSDGKSR